MIRRFLDVREREESLYSHLSQYYKKRLQTMHNKVVRFKLNMGPRTHIGQRELDRVGLLSVKDRVIQMKMSYVYKIFHGTAPDYLNAHFTRITSVHSYSTRGSPYNFIVPEIKGQASHTFFPYCHSSLEFCVQFHKRD